MKSTTWMYITSGGGRANIGIIGSVLCRAIALDLLCWLPDGSGNRNSMETLNKKEKQKMKLAKNNKGQIEILGGVMIVLLIVAAILLAMWLWPKYNVYASRQGGMAALAHAQSAKEVAVAEAKAKMESAVLLAQAEVSRAEGVAKANKIIGESLKNNEAYLRYLWITDVAGANVDKTVVYVPTEVQLPIMEAGRTVQTPKP